LLLLPQALMGPSGAGKSTFMDILAMRKSVGNLSGRLLLSGRPANTSFIRKTAYVPQVQQRVLGNGAESSAELESSSSSSGRSSSSMIIAECDRY
jgi:ABC-type iron transport system FetAB ATPase subunit